MQENIMNETITNEQLNGQLNEYLWPIIGSIIGFFVFIAGTIMLGGVYNRPSVDNGRKFRLDGLVEFIKAPFMVGSEQFKAVWTLYPNLSIMDRLDMLQLNWVAMVTVGAGIGAGLVAGVNAISKLF